MLDIKFIRENLEEIKIAARNKKIKLDFDRLLALDKSRRQTMQEMENLKAEQNNLSKVKPDAKTIKELQSVKEKIKKLSAGLKASEEEYLNLMCQVPTVTSKDTPIGKDDSENKEIFKWGKIPAFGFPIKDHIQLGKDLDILDMERGTKVAGYRGYYVKNEGVMLMMAFLNYAMAKLAAKGYHLIIPPTLVKGFALFGSGYFKGLEHNGEVDEIYQVATSDKEADGTASKDKKFLVGTAEPSLLAYYADEVLKDESLPIRLGGFSQCYRSEIGSYGKDTKGFFRVHEFMKVEQVAICRADEKESDELQQEMLNNAKELHQDLGLPYRVIQICTGDLSAGKYRSYDIEAWSPSRKAYIETGSTSSFLDWQSRRLNVKYSDKEGKRKYVYMLNSTALPTPRIFISLLENYQQADGSVVVPEVLVKYMPGLINRISKI
jgi:seryl-tRNA synthetase